MERFSPLAKAKNICWYFFIKSFPGVIYKKNPDHLTGETVDCPIYNIYYS